MKCLFLLYKKIYNDNKYFYYTRRRIIETNISVIRGNVYRIIRERVYNKNKCCYYI